MNSPLLNYKNRIVNPANPINWEHSLNRGLVACWMVPPNSGFRGGQTLWDLTRGSRKPNDGTLTNGPTWQGNNGRSGGYGTIGFTATQHVTVNSLVDRLGGSTAASFACWLRANALANTSVIFANGLDFALRYDGTPGRFTVTVRGSTGTKLFEFASATATVGVWQHVVATVDILTDTVSIYLNGRLAETNTSVDLGTDFDTGADNNFTLSSSTSNLNASLDDMRFYIGRALDANSIFTLYVQSRRGHPDTMQWISSRAAFSAGAAPPATPGVFNAAWWMVPNKNIGICRAV